MQVGDTVESKRKKGNFYFVMRVKDDGRLVLWCHGKPRIFNADPRNWRVVNCRVN